MVCAFIRAVISAIRSLENSTTPGTALGLAAELALDHVEPVVTGDRLGEDVDIHVRGAPPC